MSKRRRQQLEAEAERADSLAAAEREAREAQQSATPVQTAE